MADRTVRVRLEAVVGQFEGAMAKAGLSTRALATNVDSIGKTSEKSFKQMAMGLTDMGGGTMLAGAGLAVLAAATLKFAKDGVDSYVHLVDQVKAYKNVTGASAEESSKMVAVANVLGMSTDTMAAGMFKLSRATQQHADILEADGIVIARTKNGQVDLSATLGNVATAYQKVGAGAAGNQIVFDAFGRAGLKMIPILKQSKEQLEGFQKAAARRNQIVTDADLKAVFEYHVATRQLGEAWTGIEREVGPAAVRLLTRISVVMTELIDKAHDLAAPVGGLGSVFKSFVEAAPGIGPVVAGIDLLTSGSDKAAKAAEKHAEAEQKRADKLDASKKAIDAFTQGLKDLAGASFGVQEANDKVESQLIAFADATRAAQIGGDKFATSLQAGSIQGNKNRESLIGLTKGALDVASAMKSQGATQDQINVAMVVYRERLIDTLGQLGFNRQEVGSYVDTLLQIPGSMATVITADTAQAEDALARVLSILGAIQRAEHFTNLNVLSGRTATPIVDTGGGTSLADAIGGRGPQAGAAREAAAGSGRDAAKDAAAARDAWIKAEDDFERNMHEHHLRSDAEYLAYLNGRLAQETQFSTAWFAILDERQRVLDDQAAAVKLWNDTVARNQAEAVRLWMDTLQRENETGALSNADYRAMLVARLADLQKYSDEWMNVWNEIRQIDDQAAADAQHHADEMQQISDHAAQDRDDALGRLNSLLDDEAKIRKQQEDLAAAHRQKMADIQAGFVADQQKIMDDRSKQLLGWARVDERVSVAWGNSISALTGNVRDEMSIFSEWVTSLAAARARGVSEEVISLLGLDQGPQALGQLRMFATATDAEVADLNQAVVDRTKQAGDQVAAEAGNSYSKVAALLKDLAEKHAAEVEKLTEDFLADEQALTAQLAALGTEAGRSYGQAIADGLASTVPAIRQAAQAAQDAQTAANAASGAAHDANVRAHNPGDLKDKTTSASPAAYAGIVSPVVSVGGPQVSFEVKIGDKTITDMVEVTQKQGAVRTALARVNA